MTPAVVDKLPGRVFRGYIDYALDLTISKPLPDSYLLVGQLIAPRSSPFVPDLKHHSLRQPLLLEAP
jgi:hypothetical protein